MEKIKGIVYKITNLINGKIYIGQTIQKFKERIWQHKYHARKEKPLFLISRAIKKHKPENFKFEIIDYADCPLELNKKESYYISLYNSIDKTKGYNVMEMQDGIIVYSKERREKLSEETKKRFENNNNTEVRGRGWSNKQHTKYIGAYFVRGKNWVSYICCNSTKFYLGSFCTEIDAAMAYDIKAIELFGINAKLNFPEFLDDYLNNLKHPERKVAKKIEKISSSL